MTNGWSLLPPKPASTQRQRVDRWTTDRERLTHPAVPYVGELPVVLHPGRMVLVQGRVTPNAIRFSVNLACGSESTADIALHVNPRFDERRVVRNVRMAGVWGEEESSASWRFPMGRQLPFVLLIYATTDVYYKIKMVRHRKRKTIFGLTPAEEIKKAVNSVIQDGMNVLAPAKQYNIPRQTLERYVKRAKAAASPDEL